MSLLELDDLRVRFGPTEVLRGVSLLVEPGKTLGIVGESGCGKSMTGLSVIGMIPQGGEVSGGRILFEGRDLAQTSPKEFRAIRGQEITMAMQDPFTSLNPMMRVGDQIAEVMVLHKGTGWGEARRQAVDMLDKVGVPSPEASAHKYPHQMSGGQRQRVVIACAFIAKPKLLIADEPTTALDVTLQAQILHLLRDLQQSEGVGLMLITHDIGVVAAMSDSVAVFYGGRVVECGPAHEVLGAPMHPYTQGLLSAMPVPGRERLQAIAGQPPDFRAMPVGCSFGPRCPAKEDKCDQAPHAEAVEGRRIECWFAGAISNRP